VADRLAGPAFLRGGTVSNTELPALLRAVKEQPEDDLPRLVLADWLEEHGDGARGEFVRVQCRMARLAADDPDLPAVQRRERELRARHAARWVGDLKRFTHFSTFERGLAFLQVSSCNAFLFPAARRRAAHRSPAYEWVSGLRFPWCQPGRAIRRFLKQPEAFAGLTHLEMGFGETDPDSFADFLSLPHLGLLTHLDLSGSRVGDAGVTALARSPHLARLTTLGLDGNDVSDEGVRQLAASPYLGRLTSLSLNHNPIGDRGADLLAESPGLRGLRNLSLIQYHHDTRISPDGGMILLERFGAGFRPFTLTMPPPPPYARRQ
jgi:uncharacterized protein (TIGR02996 family)